MRAWIQSSLFGVPLPERILPSLSRTSSVLALARPGLRRVGMKKVSVPGMRALACPKALDRPKRSTMRLASATSRLSVPSAPRRLFALLMLRLVPQGEQGFGDERRALLASGQLVDRSARGQGALEPLHCAHLSEYPGVARSPRRFPGRLGFCALRAASRGRVVARLARPRLAARASRASSRRAARRSLREGGAGRQPPLHRRDALLRAPLDDTRDGGGLPQRRDFPKD